MKLTAEEKRSDIIKFLKQFQGTMFCRINFDRYDKRTVNSMVNRGLIVSTWEGYFLTEDKPSHLKAL